MAKVVLVCSRDPRNGPRIGKLLKHVSRAIIPDNITPRDMKIVRNGDTQIAVVNPSSSVCIQNCSVLLGHMVGPSEGWWNPCVAAPDGAYGLFRVGDDRIELISDVVASKTIWYAMSEGLFIASTSQRAIVMLLGSYQANVDAAAWMLSSGCLGPGNSWDARIRIVNPDSTVGLDLASWSLSIESRPAVFDTERLPFAEHKRKLANVLERVSADAALDYSSMAMTLSGGADSRGLLMMIKDKDLERCVTWGRAASLNDTRNDAYIAEKVARHYGFRHQYFATDPDNSSSSTEKIFQRFLVSGEGRVARISGYTDGFSVWKALFEQDIQAVIRGDMVFGLAYVPDEFAARYKSRLTVLSDFTNLPDAELLGLPSQQIPEHLRRRDAETLDTWRDRLYQTYNQPVVIAGLTELKSSYVEVITPLLSNSIVSCVRTLPDKLRRYKKLWRHIVSDDSCNIPLAETSAPTGLDVFLRSREVVDVILSELDAAETGSSIPTELIDLIRRGIEISPAQDVKRSRIKRALRPYVPETMRLFAHSFRNKSVLDINTLAFRAFVISRMSRILADDARVKSRI